VLPLFTLEAKVETFFLTSGLPQVGQTTSVAAAVLRMSFSKEFPHVGQVYS
jgi:membrane protein YqaA with SNARE-associated domain